MRAEAWQQLPGRQPPLHVQTGLPGGQVAMAVYTALAAVHLTKVSASRTSVTSLTCCTSSRAAARGSTFRPKVVEGAQMWVNLRLHMHADRGSAWLGGLLQCLQEATGSGGRMGVATCLRAHA